MPCGGGRGLVPIFRAALLQYGARLRSDILHGSGLMEMDRDADFGWSPPEQGDKDLMKELWVLTKLSMRNWLKNPSSSARALTFQERTLREPSGQATCSDGGLRQNP